MSAVVVVLVGLTVWNTALAVLAWVELGSVRRDLVTVTRGLKTLADRERAAYYPKDEA